MVKFAPVVVVPCTLSGEFEICSRGLQIFRNLPGPGDVADDAGGTNGTVRRLISAANLLDSAPKVEPLQVKKEGI